MPPHKPFKEPPLTDEQRTMVEEHLDMIDKVEAIARSGPGLVRKSFYLLGLAGAKDVAAWALVKAAATYVPDNGNSFRPYAFTAIHLWLLTAARQHSNEFGNYKRKRKRPPMVQFVEFPDTGACGSTMVEAKPDTTAEDADEGRVLRELVDRLPRRERAVIKALFFAGKKQRSVAKRLRLSRSSVSHYKQRALEMLREMMGVQP